MSTINEQIAKKHNSFLKFLNSEYREFVTFEFAELVLLDKFKTAIKDNDVNFFKSKVQFELVRKIIENSINPEMQTIMLASLLADVSAAKKGKIRGDELEKICGIISTTLGNKIQQIKTQVKVDGFAENFDLVIILRNGSSIYFTIQIDLWHGGAQQNRSDKYLNYKNQNIYHIVAEDLPMAALNSKKNNKLKQTILPHLDRIIYPTDIIEVVNQFYEKTQ